MHIARTISCEVPGCARSPAAGLVLCKRHCAQQANRVTRSDTYSCTWNLDSSDPHAGMRILQETILILQFERKRCGPFLPSPKDSWLEPESKKAYRLLRRHIRGSFCHRACRLVK